MVKLAVFENLCRTTKRKLNCFQDWLVPFFFFYIDLFLCLDATHVADQSKQRRCCWYTTQSLWARLLHMYDSCSKDLLPRAPHCRLPLEHFPWPTGPNWPRRHAPAKGWLPGNIQHGDSLPQVETRIQRSLWVRTTQITWNYTLLDFFPFTPPLSSLP